jgi:hypothetical protein
VIIVEAIAVGLGRSVRADYHFPCTEDRNITKVLVIDSRARCNVAGDIKLDLVNFSKTRQECCQT